VHEALGQRPDDLAVLEVQVAKSTASSFRIDLERACRERGVEMRSVAMSEVNALSEAPRHDQGVVARVALSRVVEVETFLEQHTGRRARKPLRLLALDGVTNAQNVGMVVRTVVACGLDGMLWPRTGMPWVQGLVVKASASAVYRCNVLRCETLVEGLHALQGAGFEVLGLAHPGEARLFDHAPAHRAIFVAGSETHGLSGAVRELSDATLEVPLVGPVESLNVAVAASLACFHAANLLAPSESAATRGETAR
jgi:23S rRNA (guanosine2251-2'-O)-methyltransferase